jgi:hypothetical protein
MLQQGVRLEPEIVELPLADDARRETAAGEPSRHADVLIPVEPAAATGLRHIPVADPAVPAGILAGQQRDACGRRLGHRIEVREFQPAGCQRIDVRRPTPSPP